MTAIVQSHIQGSYPGSRSEPEWEQWLEGLEQRLGQLGCTAPRFYVEASAPALEKVLLKRGYRVQIEVGLLDKLFPDGRWTPLSPDLTVTLRPVVTDRDWQQKLELHSAKDEGPDGHVTLSADWVALERRKCETGAMRVYLVQLEEQVCGTVGAIEVGDLLRLKNLVIHPEWRQRGIGVATVQALRNQAIRLNKQGFGCFALLNGGGQRVYERAGLSVVTQQIEWYRCPTIA